MYLGVVDQGIGPDNELVALKKERWSSRITPSRSPLAHEHNVYNILAGHPFIPAVKAYGKQGNFNVLVMDLLGPSLGDHFRQQGKRLDLGSSAVWAWCVALILFGEAIHSRSRSLMQ